MASRCGAPRQDTGHDMESVLSFFVSDAAAQATAPAGGASGLGALVLPAMLIVLFYFFLIRPQQKKQKEHRLMLDALAAGNEVVTGGGVLGKVMDVGEHFVTVEVAPGVSVKVQKHTIAAVVPKDTIKNA